MAQAKKVSSAQTGELRDMPRDLPSERALLGALLLDGTLFDKIMREFRRLTPEEFFDKKNALVYAAMSARYDHDASGFDSTIIRAYLERNGELEAAGGTEYLARLQDEAGTPKSVAEYARLIDECYRRRLLIAIAEKVIDKGYAPDKATAEELFEEAQGAFYNATVELRTEKESSPQAMLDVSLRVIERIKENQASGTRMRGATTGFPELDELTQGLQPGTLNIIAARPGVGKTSFAMNIIEWIATLPEVSKPALVFSLEMPSESIALRMLSNFGKVPIQKLVNGEVSTSQWYLIIQKLNMLTGKKQTSKGVSLYNKLYIDDSGSITPSELRARAREIYEQAGGLSAIMVDYVQLMKADSSSENRALELGSISRSLKLLSKELECPVLALSQLNREVDSRKDHRPMNSDLRESGSLEQDADLILFLMRSSMYRENKEENGDDGKALLIVGKNRNGALRDIDLQFVGEYTSFYPAEMMQVDDVPPPPDPAELPAQ